VRFSRGTAVFFRLQFGLTIMSITYKSEVPKRKYQKGHCKPLPRPDLNVPARLKVGHLMTIYGLCHSAIYVHLNKKLIPPADGVIASRPFWKTSTIKHDLEK